MINFIQTKKYCKEDISKIKNYDKAIADTTKTWHCHHSEEWSRKSGKAQKGKSWKICRR